MKLTETLGAKYARTCRRLVLDYLAKRRGNWTDSADLHPLAPPGRVRVNTEIDGTPFGFDDPRGTVYDAGPSGEPDLWLLGDVLRGLVADGSIVQRDAFPRAYRLAEWVGAAEAAERAGVKEKTWTAYVARDQAPRPGRRNPDTGKAEWEAVVIGEWIQARPGAGARTDLKEQDMQVLEFSYGGGTIGGAMDVVRQATPQGEAVPSVSQAGRLGFEVSAGAEVIARLKAALEKRGETCYVTGPQVAGSEW